ncbi:MAG: BBE domain-containing protein [Rhodospirillales bacterium]
MVSQRKPRKSDRLGFNRRWCAPYLENIYTPADAKGLISAVIQGSTLPAGASDPGLRVVSGRHCYENFVFNERSVTLIDLVRMNQVGQDSEGRYYVDGGCPLWEAFKHLYTQYGVMLPGGSCYSVGAGGHITGGGYGLFSRAQGLVIDHLTGVDIVVTPTHGEAKILYCDADSYEDLFWAVRGGGGGNFGVIARYYFEKLPIRPPEQVMLQSWALPWESVTPKILNQLISDAAAFSSKDSNWNQFEILHLFHKAAGSISYLIQTASDPGEMFAPGAVQEIEDQFKERLEELRKLGLEPQAVAPRIYGGAPNLYAAKSAGADPSMFTQYLSTYDAVQTLNGSGPNQFGKYKSAYHKQAFDSGQIQALYDGLTAQPEYKNAPINMSQCLLQVDSYGGQINKIPLDETAIWQRQSILKLQYQAYWNDNSPVGEPDTGLALKYEEWMRGMYTKIYSATGGWPNPYYDNPDNPSQSIYQGCYYNYCDRDLGINGAPDPSIEFAMKMYFGPNVNKLREVKAKYDPYNIWNSDQSIPLPTI